jgi:type III pantothenate kinase
MLLAIEQGNTNTLFAVHDGETWIAQWRSATESTRTADEYAVWLSQLFEMNGLSDEEPQRLHHLQRRAAVDLQPAQPVAPLSVGRAADHRRECRAGRAVRIDKPSEAGADRLVNAVGAHIAYPGAR